MIQWVDLGCFRRWGLSVLLRPSWGEGPQGSNSRGWALNLATSMVSGTMPPHTTWCVWREEGGSKLQTCSCIPFSQVLCQGGTIVLPVLQMRKWRSESRQSVNQGCKLINRNTNLQPEFAY